MAKAKSKKQPDGPYVGAALFCEKILKEDDGVTSYLRVVDILSIPKPTSDDLVGPDGKPALVIATPLAMVVMFKSGNFKGEQEVRVEIGFPSGRRMEGATAAAQFLGDEKGAAIYAKHMTIPVMEEGLYWYDVILGKKTVTRVPLRIVYTKPSPEAQPSSPVVAEPDGTPETGKRKKSGARGDAARKKA